ncbi:MAG: hypothetical protein AB7I13_01225 [Vicinamibacterales bacterium]
MRPIDSRGELLVGLRAASLNEERLDFWRAWKVFKAFLRREVSDVYDAASFQLLAEDDRDNTPGSVVLVRQFSERDPDGEDIPAGRLVVEFYFEPAALKPWAEAECWTIDYPTLEDWAATVEALPAFQAVASSEVSESIVYYEDAY